LRNARLRFGAVIAVAGLLAGCGGPGGEPQAPITAPPLPEGRLQFLSSGLESARYLALDDLARADRAVTATVLVVGTGATRIEGRYGLQTRRETIDCASRTIADETAGFFDQAGRLAETRLLTGRIGRAMTAADAEVQAACDPAAAGKGRILAGWRSARRDAQAPPPTLAATAEANPNDPDGWAWLCAAAARGAWRAQALDDCDKAVALLPDDVATRLDRGYLRLKVGRAAQADADFKAVMAKAPQDAVAHFGHSLVAGMRGDMAASRRARGPALDLDPNVAEWVATTYRLPLSPEFRSR
jgi:hypothetical protein